MDGGAWNAVNVSSLTLFGGKISAFIAKSLSEVEKVMAPHSSTFAWKIPWMEEPGGLQSMGSRRVRHD